MIRIAIDAMGGDFGAEPIISGVIEALKEAEFKAVLVGDSNAIKPLIPQPYLKNIEFIEATEVISMSDGATDALKRKDSTIYKAVELLKDKNVDAVVSAGHSGATMSLATLRVGRLKNVSRPAIATLMPNSKETATLVLDVGANGEEESKGSEVSKEAFKLVSRLDSFVGNAEGNQIFDGSIDVMVCDGFMGNILLKTSEGVADAIGKIIKKQVKKSPLAMAGSVLMRKVFKTLKKQVSYDEYGGAPLLGVNGCVIISHGKSNSKAIKNAIFQAIKFANSNINKVIEEELSHFAR